MPGAGNASVIAGWGIGPVGVVVSVRALVAIGIIVSLALIQARGVRPGRVLQNSLTTITVSALVAFVVAGLLVAPSRPAAVAVVSHRAPLTAWLIALVPVMFSYTGWNAAVYVAEEVRDPTRNVPLALGLGTASVIALYLALNTKRTCGSCRVKNWSAPSASASWPPPGCLDRRRLPCSPASRF